MGTQKPTRDRPIGVFDSGVGGLSVWREIVRLLPYEDTLYFADQAHLPYGPRSLTEIRHYAEKITNFLLAEGAKIIVVACNTASGAALQHLRATFPGISFVGMEPAIKPAATATRTGTIGVIATPATFQGRLFHQLVDRFAAEVQLETQTCPGLVEAVEAGALNTAETRELLRRYLTPMLETGIDHLVLGCTHYPFLSEAIARITGPEVTLVDPAPAVARQVRRLLNRDDLLRKEKQPPEHIFYTSGPPLRLAEMACRLVEYGGLVLPIRWNGEALVSEQGTEIRD